MTVRDPLRIRLSPGGAVLTGAPNGVMVDVLGSAQDGWVRVAYAGVEGYASAAYLRMIDEEPAQQEDQQEAAMTTLVCTDGTMIVLMGCWRVAQD